MSRYNGCFTFIVSLSPFFLSRFFSRLHHSIVLAYCQHVFCDPELFCVQRSGGAHTGMVLVWYGGRTHPGPAAGPPPDHGTLLSASKFCQEKHSLNFFLTPKPLMC